MALTFFSLVNSTIPSEQELAALRVKLTEAANGQDSQSVNKKQFCQVEFWFDQYEGKPDAAMQSRWEAERAARQEESEYDDEDDDQEGKAKRIDTERVQKIKELLFDLYRVATGEDKL